MLTNTKTQIPTIPKKNAFNAIRLLFCFMVIFLHTLNSIGIGQGHPLLDGHLAVCGFFIISGFWVTKSYFSSGSLKIFFEKRAKKILPMYYISVIGFSIVCAFFSTLTLKEYFFGHGNDYFKYLFWNCCFLNFMHPSLPGCFGGGPVNGALWTIKIEIGFYAVLPLIMFVWKRLPTTAKKNFFLGSLYVLSVVLEIILRNFSEKFHLPHQIAHQQPSFISFFVSGMLILLNWDFFIKYKHWLIVPAVLAFGLRYVTKTEILFPMALAIIIVYLALNLKFLSSIGNPIDFSWGMYLFHFPLMQIYKNYGSTDNAILYVGSIIGVSFILTFIFEKYVQKKIK